MGERRWAATLGSAAMIASAWMALLGASPLRRAPIIVCLAGAFAVAYTYLEGRRQQGLAALVALTYIAALLTPPSSDPFHLTVQGWVRDSVDLFLLVQGMAVLTYVLADFRHDWQASVEEHYRASAAS